MFSPGRCAAVVPDRSSVRASRKLWPSLPRAPGDDAARRRIDDVAGGVEGDEGSDREPVRQRDRRRADAALHGVAAAAELADRRAGARADAAFGNRAVGRGLRRRIAARRVGPDRAACRRPADRTAPRPARSARTRRRTGSRPCAPRDTSSRRSPHRARTRCRRRTRSRAPARRDSTDRADRSRACPGAEPRTATPPVAPFSTRTTVHPVGRSVRV